MTTTEVRLSSLVIDMDPVKESASGESLRRRETRSNNANTADAPPAADDGAPQEVFGDMTTNVVVLAMVVIAWISEYASRSNCTC